MNTTILSAKERIIVSLDVDDFQQISTILDQVADHVGMIKFGLQLGTSEGWGQVMDGLRADYPNLKVFCDTKFKDIPQTMYGAARSIQRHRPAMFNVMADNNDLALVQTVAGSISAVEDFEEVNQKSVILGVTVLTSITDEQSQSIYGDNAAAKVLEFGAKAAAAGLDGLVCSAQEAKSLRAQSETKDMVLVTPGIRPQWASHNDQQRPMTPSMAVEAGADYLVIGRPIIEPPDGMSPKEAVQKIIEELETA